MAEFGAWINGFLEIDGVDLSDHVHEMSLESPIDELADNVHGDRTSKERAGLEGWTVTVTFFQDFAFGEVDSLLSRLSGVGHGPFSVRIRAENAAVAEDNPDYVGQCVLASYTPFSGEHGVNLQATATFRVAGQLQRFFGARLRPVGAATRMRPVSSAARRAPLVM